MLSYCHMFLPKQCQGWLLHCWSKQHKVCHCYDELCWLGIKLSCPWERIFCSDDPNCAKWKCLAAQMTNMSHSGMLQMEAACWKSLSGLCPTSFIHLVTEDPRGKKLSASAIVFPLSHLFVWADCVFCGNQLMGMDACQQLQPWLCWLFHSLINLGQRLQHYWRELRLRPRGRATSSSCHVDWGQTEEATVSNYHDLSLTVLLQYRTGRG